MGDTHTANCQVSLGSVQVSTARTFAQSYQLPTSPKLACVLRTVSRALTLDLRKKMRCDAGHGFS